MPSSANKDDRTAAATPAGGPAPSPGGSPLNLRSAVPRSRLVLFAAIVICGTAVDLATKHWVFDRVAIVADRQGDWRFDLRDKRWNFVPMGQGGNRQVRWVWPDYVAIELSLNRGALFGFGQGYVPVFVGLSLLAGGGILYWLFVIGEARDLWLCLALALVSAGICGNLYDRLGLPGLVAKAPAGANFQPQRIYAVRDWILFMYGDHSWPNFNIADSLLVCGAGVLLAQFCFAGRRSPTPE